MPPLPLRYPSQASPWMKVSEEGEYFMSHNNILQRKPWDGSKVGSTAHFTRCWVGRTSLINGQDQIVQSGNYNKSWLYQFFFLINKDLD